MKRSPLDSGWVLLIVLLGIVALVCLFVLDGCPMPPPDAPAVLVHPSGLPPREDSAEEDEEEAEGWLVQFPERDPCIRSTNRTLSAPKPLLIQTP